ncbi:hypothetical protein EMCRGX_G013736 [Ephydatia muelleri]
MPKKVFYQEISSHHSHSVALLSYTYVWVQVSIALSWTLHPTGSIENSLACAASNTYSLKYPPCTPINRPT